MVDWYEHLSLAIYGDSGADNDHDRDEYTTDANGN